MKPSTAASSTPSERWRRRLVSPMGARNVSCGWRLSTTEWTQVRDILDVWFDSGSTHCVSAGTASEDLKWPADAVSRRLRPASRLVPFLAAGIVRYAGPRALRRGSHPWLHHGRARPQDVQIAEQFHGTAGRHQAVRRRHPASVGCLGRLLPKTSASALKSSRPMSMPIASCATRCAGCLGSLAHFEAGRQGA